MDWDNPGAGARLTVPVFPLPNVVFFPKTFLPLHIFEMRYRSMVHDALQQDKLIAMALLEDGWEQDYEGSPPVHLTACVGKIEFSEKLANGRYNILLFGLYKVELLEFTGSSPYRQARVQVLHDQMPRQNACIEVPDREKLMTIARELMPGKIAAMIEDIDLMNEMEYESLVNTLSMAGPFRELEKQALLELNDIGDRARRLESLLEEYLEVRRFYKSLNYIRPSDPRNN